MADTSASLSATASDLAALAAAFGTQAAAVGQTLSQADGTVASLPDHWGGPRSSAAVGAATTYLSSVEPTVAALESAQSTISRWATSAETYSTRLGYWERRADELAADPDLGSVPLVDPLAQMSQIRTQWQTTCTSYAGELSGATTALLNGNLAALPEYDARAATDGAYYALVAELSVVAGLDASEVDPTGQLSDAISDMAAHVGSEDGQWIFALIETAHQGDLGEADGNFSADDILAATDPAVVRALLLQAAEHGGFEFEPERLDALVGEVVGTAWMMRASSDEEWEDIDDDIEWYERGVFKFVREEVFAPVAAFAVGGLCYTAAAGTAAATGGVSLAAAGYCGGLATATYSAANAWAHGGDLGDVYEGFTDPQAWATGVFTGVAFQGATNFLLRAPAPPVGPAGQVVDDVAGAVDDVAATSADDLAYHHTFSEHVESIATGGMWEGTYATPTAGLSPLQAQVELALTPNGLRTAVIQIDLQALRTAGYEIPAVTRVSGVVRAADGRVYTMPGGGYQMQFPYEIPPEYLKVVIAG